MIGLVYLNSNNQIIARIENVQSHTASSIIGSNSSVNGVDTTQASICITDDTNTSKVGDTLVATLVLSSTQDTQVALLTNAFNASFLKGFPSNAIGMQIIFGCSPNSAGGLPSDQQNMSDELNIVNAGVASYPIPWAALDGTAVDFTTEAQFKQLIQDFSTYKWTQVTNLRTKIAAVRAATTVDAVNAVTW